MAAIGIAACVLLLPETRDPSSPGVDALSTALTATGLGALIFAIIEAPTRGWGDPLVLAAFGASVLLLGWLVLRERRVARPMLDMTLLAQRGFLFNSVAATLVMFVLSGLLFVLPPYLQAVLGNDALGTGVRLLPMMGGLLVAARAAQPVLVRLGARATVSAGLVVLAFAAFLGSRTTVDSGYGFTALWLSVAGLGFGFALIPAMNGALGWCAASPPSSRLWRPPPSCRTHPSPRTRGPRTWVPSRPMPDNERHDARTYLTPHRRAPAGTSRAEEDQDPDGDP